MKYEVALIRDDEVIKNLYVQSTDNQKIIIMDYLHEELKFHQERDKDLNLDEPPSPTLNHMNLIKELMRY